MFRTQWDDRKNPTGEKNNGISETIPDQAMSIRTLIQRYAHGLPLSGAKTPLYEDENEFTPDFATMDLTELHEYGEDLASRLQNSRRQAETGQKSTQSSQAVSEQSGNVQAQAVENA